MKKTALIVALLLIANNIFSQTKWQWQNPLPQGNSYSDICFLDSLNGFVSGGMGIILKTTNGGKNWKILETNIQDHIKKISFTDINNGWVMCYANSTIYRTTDSGESWDLLGNITNSTLYDFRMINDSLGFASGVDSKIFKTTNGGVDWEQKEPPFFVNGINTISFVNENIGYCGGGSPYLLKSVDGGESWQALPLPFFIGDITVWSIHFTTANSGYISGYAADKGFIIYTTDGGNTWPGGALIDSAVIYDAFIKDSNTIWVNSNGKILYTTDGGWNWVELLNNIFHVFFLDENNSWSIISGNNIVHSNDGLETHEYQTSSVSHTYFNDIEITDSNNVFICGNTEILATTNGGKDWTVVHSDSEKDFLSLTTNDEELWSVGSQGTIVHSTDFGKSWDQIQTEAGYLQDIYFLNSSDGFAVGHESFVGKIFKTTDGGISWDSISNVPPADSYEKIGFSNDSVGWINSGNGIYKTEDRGNSWNLFKHGPYIMTLEVYNNCIWTSVVNKIVFSTDLGVTWNEVQVYEIINFSIRSITSIDFMNENIGWLTVDDGRIFKTVNGGFSWELEERLSALGLYSIKFLSETRGWAVGGLGAILFYGDSITDVKGNYKSDLPVSFMLYQNYPNPFNPTTKIKYYIPNRSYVSIKVFDLLGKEIATLVDSEKPSGNYEVEFNGSNLSSGIYFYRMHAGDFLDTKKVILIK